MPLELVGLLLQVAAVALFVLRNKRKFIQKTAFLYLVVAFAFHGLTEIVLRISGDEWVSRRGLSSAGLQEWVFITGIAMLVFVGGHCAISFLPFRQKAADLGKEIPARLKFFPWRLFLILGVITLTIALSRYRDTCGIPSNWQIHRCQST